MRIAHFAESYTPVINGAAIAVDLLAEALAVRHEVEVYAARYKGHQDRPYVQRFPAYCWPQHPDYPLAFPFAPRLFRHFRERRFDMVHTHSPFALGQAGGRWARRLGVPVVTTYHTLYETYAHYAPLVPKGWAAAFLKALSRRYCDSCDMVAAPTEPVRQVLLSYGVKTPIQVIPTGLRLRPPAERDSRFPRSEFGIPEGAPLVLYAGRLAREKNLGLLFHSFARVARAVPDAWLLVAGSGPEEAAARSMAAESGAGDRVRFGGFVPPDRMALVYAAADVFAFTSLTDTQGMVVTEAKAAGLAVVSVNAFGPSEVVADGVDGLLTPPDEGAFAGAVQRLLQDDELRGRMREAALQGAHRFSIEATATAYERLYEEARARAASAKKNPSPPMPGRGATE